MILDHSDPACPAHFQADICIVGAGAAGLALAREFAGSRLRIVILESGGWKEEPRTQALYNTVQTGMPFLSAHHGRFRTLGGSTTKWGGQSLPMTPLDFEKRPWVNHSGWPITYQEVCRYYDRANEFLGVDTRDYRDETGRLLGMVRPDLAEVNLDFHFSKWAPQPDLRRTYCRQLENTSNLQLLLHANTLELVVEAGRVRLIRYRSLDGREGAVDAKVFILATGALEVPRLLLASNRDGVGIGNENDLVGRFLQEHPATRLGSVSVTNQRKLQSLFNGRRANGRRYSSRLSLTPEAQASAEILNASAGFLFCLPEEDGFGFLRSTLKRRNLREIVKKGARLARESARCFPELVESAWRYGAQGRIYTPGAVCEVAASFEQEPNPNSRVTLSDELDELGMPRLCIHWALTEKTYSTAHRFADWVDQALRKLDVGALDRSDWLRPGAESLGFGKNFHDQNHHIGTTRMSTHPKDGVVDPQLRVHSLQNLYVASSSVFPTGGHSNPTLTILALCMRLGDHLKKQLPGDHDGTA